MPTIPDVEEQIKTEAVRQQLQEVNPELQANLEQEVQLERQIQELEDADQLTEADPIKRTNRYSKKETSRIN